MKGILDGFGWTGLIEKGAGLLGFELPDVVSTGLDIGREFFGGGGKGSEGLDTSGMYKRGVDLGASTMELQKWLELERQKQVPQSNMKMN